MWPPLLTWHLQRVLLILPIVSCHLTLGLAHYCIMMRLSLCGHNLTTRLHLLAHKQKCWDAPYVSSLVKSLLDGCSNSFSRARLLAASCKESGAWLNALPISSLGLHLDDDTVHIAVGLRLGIPICKPHMWSQCRLYRNPRAQLSS